MSINDNATITGLLAGMSRELRCSICLNNFNNPVTTPCGHTFCKKCIEKALNKISQCPLCNYEMNIDELHIAYSVQEIVEEYEKMKEQYQSENDVVLSQAPIEHLSDQDLVEQSLPRTSPTIPNNERLLSDVRHLSDVVIYIGKGVPVPSTEIPGATFTKEIDEKTTHVVLKPSEGNRELVHCCEDYLFGILHGCSIIQSAWLDRCAEGKSICPTKRYEITGNVKIGRTGAPDKARKDRERGKAHRLFRGLRMRFINDNKISRLYEKYIRIGGGTITEHGEIIVCAEDMDDIDVDELSTEFPDKRFLSKNWIDDCICLYEIVKKEDKHYL